MNRLSLLPIFFVVSFSILPFSFGYSQKGSAKMLLSKLKAELNAPLVAMPVEKPIEYNTTKAALAPPTKSIDASTTSINNAPWRWKSSRQPKVAALETKILSGLNLASGPSRDAELHTVKPGETIATIARYYGQSETNLRLLNGIEGGRNPVSGQVIKVKGTINAAGHNRVKRTQGYSRELIPRVPMGVDGFKVYTIKSGDNPSRIAQKFSVSAKELMALNEIENPRLLKIGQKIRIPAKKLAVKPAFDNEGFDIHVVEAGDSLWTIAQAHGVEYYTLVGLNNITNPAGLKVGQKLKIPEPK